MKTTKEKLEIEYGKSESTMPSMPAKVFYKWKQLGKRDNNG